MFLETSKLLLIWMLYMDTWLKKLELRLLLTQRLRKIQFKTWWNSLLKKRFKTFLRCHRKEQPSLAQEILLSIFLTIWMPQALSRKPQISSLSTKTLNLRFHLWWFKNSDSILLLRKVFHQASQNKMWESFILTSSHLNLNSRKSQQNSFCSFSKVKECLLSQSISAKTITRWWKVTILNKLHLWVTFVTTTWVTLWWTCL